MTIDTEKLIKSLEKIDSLHKKVKKEVEKFENSEEKIFLGIGKCNGKGCKRKATGEHGLCEYHKAVSERKKYKNLNNVFEIGVAVVVAKKTWDILT